MLINNDAWDRIRGLDSRGGFGSYRGLGSDASDLIDADKAGLLGPSAAPAAASGLEDFELGVAGLLDMALGTHLATDVWEAQTPGATAAQVAAAKAVEDNSGPQTAMDLANGQFQNRLISAAAAAGTAARDTTTAASCGARGGTWNTATSTCTGAKTSSLVPTWAIALAGLGLVAWILSSTSTFVRAAKKVT